MSLLAVDYGSRKSVDGCICEAHIGHVKPRTGSEYLSSVILAKNMVHVGYDDVDIDWAEVEGSFSDAKERMSGEILKLAHLRLYPDVASSNLIHSLLRPLSLEEETVVTPPSSTRSFLKELFEGGQEAKGVSSSIGAGRAVASSLFADRVVDYQTQLRMRASPLPPDSPSSVPNPAAFIREQFPQRSFPDVTVQVAWDKVAATTDAVLMLHSLYLFPTPLLIANSLKVSDIYKVSRVVSFSRENCAWRCWRIV